MLQPLHYSMLHTCTSHRGQSELPAPPETAHHSSKRGSQLFAWPDHPRDFAVSGQDAGNLFAFWTSPPGRASLVPLFDSGPLQCPVPIVWEIKRGINKFLKNESTGSKGEFILSSKSWTASRFPVLCLRGSECFSSEASIREIACK